MSLYFLESCCNWFYHLCQFLYRNYHSTTKKNTAISCHSLFPTWECKQTWLLLNFVPTIDFTSSQFPAYEKRQYQHISSFRWCIYHIVFFLVMYGPAFRLWRWDMIETETKGFGRSVKYNTLNTRLLICTLNFVQDPRYCCRLKKFIHWKGINKHIHTHAHARTHFLSENKITFVTTCLLFKIRNSKKSLLAHVNCAEIFCTANVCSTARHFSIKFLRFRK